MESSETKREGGETKHLVVTPPVIDLRYSYCEIIRKKYKDWIDQNINSTNCVEICITFKPTFKLACPQSLKALIKGIFDSICEDYPEVSVILLHEFSISGMFHYHGIVSRGTGKFYNTLKRNLERYIGRTEIKQIKYWDSYIKYMLKSINTPDYEKTLNIMQPSRAGIIKFFN